MNVVAPIRKNLQMAEAQSPSPDNLRVLIADDDASFPL